MKSLMRARDEGETIGAVRRRYLTANDYRGQRIARPRAATTALAGALALWAVLAESIGIWSGFTSSLGSAVSDALPGLSFGVAGAVALDRRPSNRIGRLMLLFSVCWFIPAWYRVLPVWASVVSWSLKNVSFVFLAWLVVAYPSGRVRARWHAALVAAVAALVAADAVSVLFLADAHLTSTAPDVCTTCPTNPFKLVQGDGAYDWAAQRLDEFTNVVILLAAVVLVHIWHEASGRERRALWPLWVASSLIAATFLPDQQVIGTAEVFEVRNLALTVIPLVFLAGLLHSTIRRGSVGSLILSIDRQPTAEELRFSLATALGDPSLAVLYAKRDGGFVDANGHGVELPEPGDGRAVTLLDSQDGTLGALVHDPFVAEQPELLSSVVAAARLALANQHLQALVRAQLEEVRASRGRIVEAQSDERRRLERNLHDGAQQQLLALRVLVKLAQRKHDGEPEPLLQELDNALIQTIEEIRRLARGLYPVVLSDHGLAAALDGLAFRTDIAVEVDVPHQRVSQAAEAAAYFLAAESLANATKHACATRLTIAATQNGRETLDVVIRDDGGGGATLAPGGGLAGLRDRVEALGGSFELTSPPGSGTTLRATIPCA